MIINEQGTLFNITINTFYVTDKHRYRKITRTRSASAALSTLVLRQTSNSVSQDGLEASLSMLGTQHVTTHFGSYMLWGTRVS